MAEVVPDREFERQGRISKILARYPELQEIQRELQVLSLQLVRLVTGGNKQQLAMLDRRRHELWTEFKRLLDEYGIDPEEFELRPHCSVCGDSGMLRPGVKCSCRMQRELDEEFAKSGLSAVQRLQTFATFDAQLYPDSGSFCTAGRMARRKQRFEEFASAVEQGDQELGLFLYGDTGLGKTHLSSAVANYLREQRRSVLYTTEERLVETLAREKLERETNGFREMLRQVNLLIIDDLGTAFANSFTLPIFYGVINDRVLDRRPWIISSNLSLEKIKEVYDPRIADRINGHSAEIFEFSGPSLRPRLKTLRGA